MATDYDLVIVGGGPSGAATALFFVHAAPRARVLLIDKARFPREKICAGAIGGRGDAALVSIGVRIDVPAVEVRGFSVVTRFGELVHRLDQPIGRVVRRRAFDAAMLDQVRARDVEVCDGVGFVSMRRGARSVRVHTTEGELSTKALVGADGVGSRVRRELGLGRGDLHAQAVEVDTRWVDGDRPDDLLHFDIGDGDTSGYAWDFPTLVDGESMVCRGFYRLVRGAPFDRDERDVGELLRERLTRLGIDSSTLQLKRFAERGLALHTPCAADRVLLVGEAAGIDPVLGEGIPQAILYGRMAATYLARCHRSGAYHFADYRSFLRASRVGLDLRIRWAALPFLYGRGRSVAERWVCASTHLAEAGLHYFAGHRVPRRSLVRAAGDLATATGRALRLSRSSP